MKLFIYHRNKTPIIKNFDNISQFADHTYLTGLSLKFKDAKT